MTIYLSKTTFENRVPASISDATRPVGSGTEPTFRHKAAGFTCDQRRPKTLPGEGEGGGQLKHTTQAREISTRLWAKARRIFFLFT